ALDFTKGASIGFMDREISNANVTVTGATVTVPPGFDSTSPFAISQAAATTRWADVQSFRTASGTYSSSNGPYSIFRIDTSANTGTGTFQVSVNTAPLAPGAYKLQTITVGAEAAVPVFSTLSFTAISQLAYFQGQFALAIGDANNRISTLQNSLNSTNAQLTTAQSTINSLSTLLYVSIGVAVLAVVMAVVSVAVLVRRIPRRGGGSGGGEESKGPEEI